MSIFHRQHPRRCGESSLLFLDSNALLISVSVLLRAGAENR
jgi:hypothetical protein